MSSPKSLNHDENYADGTDTNGCIASSAFTILQPAPITATTSQQNISCYGEMKGTATVLASGGSGAYTYSWSPSGGSAATASNLAAGTYTCTITDNLGCSLQKQVTLTTPVSTTWNGAWSNGYPQAGDLAIIASNYTSTGNLSACALSVTGNAVVTVLPGHTFTITNEVNVANTASLTFESNANLLQDPAYMGTTTNNLGNVTVKRTANLKWKDYIFWGSPVSGQNVRSFSNDTDLKRFYRMNEGSNVFKQRYDSGDSTVNFGYVPVAYPFDAGSGYMIRSSNQAPFVNTTTVQPWTGVWTGTPHNGDVPVAVTLNANGNGQGYNMLAEMAGRHCNHQGQTRT